MTLAGSPDFQAQIAPTITPLGTFNVNTGGVQTFDISSLLLPYHQALAVYWLASPASVLEPVLAAITSNFDAVPLLPFTLIADGGNVVCAIPAAFFLDQASTVINLTASPPAGGASPILGTLVVVGLSSPPVVIPTERRQYIGTGNTTDLIVTAGGANATILAAPRQGQYYRIKSIQLTVTGAPVANTSVTIRKLSDLTAFLFWRVAGTGNDELYVSMDMEWDDGLQCHNSLGVNCNVIVLYEIWNS